MNAPDPAAQRRAARRAAALSHHPDLGGDAEELIAALGAADALMAGAHPIGQVLTVRSTSRVRRTVRTVRRTARGVRRRLPRGVPGWTRYHQL